MRLMRGKQTYKRALNTRKIAVGGWGCAKSSKTSPSARACKKKRRSIWLSAKPWANYSQRTWHNGHDMWQSTGDGRHMDMGESRVFGRSQL